MILDDIVYAAHFLTKYNAQFTLQAKLTALISKSTWSIQVACSIRDKLNFEIALNINSESMLKMEQGLIRSNLKAT